MEKKKRKKDNELLEWLKYIISIALIIVSAYAILNYVPFFNTKQYYVIVSSSMTPLYEVGDVVIMNKNFQREDLVEDQVIAFYNDIDECGTREVVVHYIAAIYEGENNTITIKTKHLGENPGWDSWTLQEDDVVGTLYYHIPWVGKLILFAGSIFGKVVIAVDLIIIYLVIDFFKSKSKAKYI